MWLCVRASLASEGMFHTVPELSIFSVSCPQIETIASLWPFINVKDIFLVVIYVYSVIYVHKDMFQAFNIPDLFGTAEGEEQLNRTFRRLSYIRNLYVVFPYRNLLQIRIQFSNFEKRYFLNVYSPLLFSFPQPNISLSKHAFVDNVS